METRFRVLLLIPVLALGLNGCGMFHMFSKKEAPPTPLGAESEQPPPQSADEPVINPEVARRKIKTPAIRSEDFEIGAYIGMLSIEDFGHSAVTGAKIDYHINEDFFLEGTFGQAKGDTTSYERLAGGARLLSDSQRRYSYYALNAAWDALPGEVFVGKDHAYNTSFYLTAGMGFTEFGGNKHFTANGGFGYRILFTRWLAGRFDFRDHLFDIDLTGPKKVTHNLEGSLGLSVYF